MRLYSQRSGGWVDSQILNEIRNEIESSSEKTDKTQEATGKFYVVSLLMGRTNVSKGNTLSCTLVLELSPFVRVCMVSILSRTFF